MNTIYYLGLIILVIVVISTILDSYEPHYMFENFENQADPPENVPPPLWDILSDTIRQKVHSGQISVDELMDNTDKYIRHSVEERFKNELAQGKLDPKVKLSELEVIVDPPEGVDPPSAPKGIEPVTWEKLDYTGKKAAIELVPDYMKIFNEVFPQSIIRKIEYNVLKEMTGQAPVVQLPTDQSAKQSTSQKQSKHPVVHPYILNLFSGDLRSKVESGRLSPFKAFDYLKDKMMNDLKDKILSGKLVLKDEIDRLANLRVPPEGASEIKKPDFISSLYWSWLGYDSQLKIKQAIPDMEKVNKLITKGLERYFNLDALRNLKYKLGQLEQSELKMQQSQQPLVQKTQQPPPKETQIAQISRMVGCPLDDIEYHQLNGEYYLQIKVKGHDKSEPVRKFENFASLLKFWKFLEHNIPNLEQCQIPFRNELDQLDQVSHKIDKTYKSVTGDSRLLQKCLRSIRNGKSLSKDDMHKLTEISSKISKLDKRQSNLVRLVEKMNNKKQGETGRIVHDVEEMIEDEVKKQLTRKMKKRRDDVDWEELDHFKSQIRRQMDRAMETIRLDQNRLDTLKEKVDQIDTTLKENSSILVELSQLLKSPEFKRQITEHVKVNVESSKPSNNQLSRQQYRTVCPEHAPDDNHNYDRSYWETGNFSKKCGQ